MAIKVGDRVPNGTFTVMTPDGLISAVRAAKPPAVSKASRSVARTGSV